MQKGFAFVSLDHIEQNVSSANWFNRRLQNERENRQSAKPSMGKPVGDFTMVPNFWIASVASAHMA
jgi:hypothetical protein